jgi:GNAT superfamily N-acetyltransferase
VIEIVDIDSATADDGLLAQLARIQSLAMAEEGDGSPAPTEAERMARYRNPLAPMRYWLAFLDGRPAGFAYLGGSPSFVTTHVGVLPPFRRNGVGTALFERVREAARERELPSFAAHYSTEAGAVFSQRMGGRDDQRDVKSILRLRVAQLAEPSPPAGVALRTWVGACPDELVESLVIARSAISDAPAPGELALPGWTVERQRDDEQALLGRKVESHTTVAVEDSEVVALTIVRVQPGSFAVTDDTATRPEHRGRGLATAVKLESLRRLRESRPDVELVGTMNAERNAAMLAINRKLGFEPMVVLTTAVVTL